MAMSYEPGALLARRYRVGEALGRGGLATAYRVIDVVTERRLVLKLVDAADDESRSIFHGEFQRLAGLLHPHLVRVRDLGHLDGRWAYFTADDDAATALPEAALPDWSSVRPLLLDVVDALRCLHGLRLRHGDVKPANIVVGPDGRGTLIDLSCTTSFGRPPRVAGTPGFIAPELLQGVAADGRADLFGLGATLAWLGEQLALPDEVTALATQLMRDDPDDRPPDVDEVARRLGERARPTALASGVPPQLIGRATWLADAEQRLERALAGEAGPIVITGPAGVGRSRLLEELKWQAQRRVVVIEGAASRPDAVDELLRRALDIDDDRSGIALVVDTLDRWPSDEPRLLVLDDAQRLTAPQREAWWALLRSLPGRITALTTTSNAPPALPDASILSVEPLGANEVARWVGEKLPKARLGDVMRLTEGRPAPLAELLGALRLGELHADDLRRAQPFAAVSLRELALWPESVVAALALVAARGGRAPRAPIDPAAVTEALARGWLVMDGDDVVATRPLALSSFPVELRRRAHRAAVDLVDSRDPERVVHLLGAGATSEAAQQLWSQRGAMRASPDAWLVVAEAIATRADDSLDLRAVAAEIYELAGRTREALSLIARARRRDPDDPRVRLRAGAICLRCGQLSRARRYLEPIAESSPEALDLLSRTVVKQGDYAAARTHAERALALDPDDPWLRAALHDDLGVAASYLGDSATSREHLEKASALHEQHGQPRAQARSTIYLALADYRDGKAREAAAGFAEALRIAEESGAADLVVYAAQNLAAATHQLGDLGRAASAYERALRLAVALGDRSSEAGLRANLAKLYTDLGLLEQAAEAAVRAEAVATEAGVAIVAATAASAAGEVALLRGDAEGAIAALRRARQTFGEQSQRELVETDLHLADALGAAGRDEGAREALARAAAITDTLEADDLRARLALGRARRHLRQNASEDALPLLEEALDHAQRADQRELEAEVEASLARACADRGAATLSAQHAQRARGLWEQTVTTLPSHLASAFWRHPHRALPPLVTHRQAERPQTDRIVQLERLLAINKRLTSALEPNIVLDKAIDAALELTGAERGFVILDRDGELTMRAARNVQTDDPNELEFSQSITHRVIRSGRPVITVDARADERFEAQRSVHAMQLQSVACVPIIAAAGVLGALYLDHRYVAGMFGPEQTDLLSAFADQVAIALHNAFLHETLAERTRQLDALTRGQKQEIDALQNRVRHQQKALELRFDYGQIIGDSPAMRAVLLTLDRVIDSDIPVSIQGESGTGKELLAKAIHYNGPRRDGPIVTINCGAVPESLLESELFGHVKGAFTGADSDRPGLFVAARGGSVFLDEVGEMPAAMQVKLLRVLQEREVMPLGSHQTVPIDVRVITATNRKLRTEVEEGRFREDLYYRLGVVEVEVPPLRDRTEDIPALTEHLLQRAADKLGRPRPRVDPSALEALLAHHWPGNVRELENVVTKAVLLADDGVITPEALRLQAPRPPKAATTRKAFEEEAHQKLLELLQLHEWNVSEVARSLGVARTTVYRRMRKYGLEAS